MSLIKNICVVLALLALAVLLSHWLTAGHDDIISPTNSQEIHGP